MTAKRIHSPYNEDNAGRMTWAFCAVRMAGADCFFVWLCMDHGLRQFVSARFDRYTGGLLVMVLHWRSQCRPSPFLPLPPPPPNAVRPPEVLYYVNRSIKQHPVYPCASSAGGKGVPGGGNGRVKCRGGGMRNSVSGVGVACLGQWIGVRPPC